MMIVENADGTRADGGENLDLSRFAFREDANRNQDPKPEPARGPAEAREVEISHRKEGEEGANGATEKRRETFEDFWPKYLGKHSKPATRAVHYAGTVGGVGITAVAIATGQLWLLPVGLVAPYVPLFASHYLIEKNRPQTLGDEGVKPTIGGVIKNILWSMRADFRMLKRAITGELKDDLRRFGVAREGGAGQ